MKIVNQNEFKAIIKNGTTLVDFYADWCGPCKALSPILEELDEEYPNINFVKVNVDSDVELAGEYGIMSIPCVFLFKDGQEVGHFTGLQSKDAVKDFLAKA